MTHTIRLNFKGIMKFKFEKYQCPYCLAMSVTKETPDFQSVSSSHSSDSLPQTIPLVSTSQVEEDSQEHLQVSCLTNKDLRQSQL